MFTEAGTGIHEIPEIPEMDGYRGTKILGTRSWSFISTRTSDFPLIISYYIFFQNSFEFVFLII
jgi:hypothetical protein